MKRILIRALLIIIAITMCYPIIFMIVGAFMGEVEISRYLTPVLGQGEGYATFNILPEEPNLWSIIKVLIDTPEFFVLFLNSSIIAISSILGQIAFALAAAWGFAKYEFTFKKTIFFIYIILMLLPFQVLMVSEYLVLKELHLIDTLYAIVLPAIFATYPVFIMYHFFLNIPTALIEAARIEGAGEWRIFTKIGIPLGKSGIASMVILSFLEVWNLVEQPLTFINDKTKWPLSIYFTDIQIEDASVVFVSILFAFIPSVILFYFGYDHIEQGIMASAIKE